ncbi:IclR family transcriptional regulator [Jatrophihabitans lederbergiae]|uniref:IclR family transcriptional regulator n=1 Tax=Jatrophihabitans lederbergiae TaxID=3075547 RepID=A0ABU2J8N1_9ACTN|nr:IclR family transcriptional regulator [Jatrophihabitans sp. DSM 44399]MDT0260994.1 IclR family transcriptional regulator [Jatrophihabitans sp. DSM 44399]
MANSVEHAPSVPTLSSTRAVERALDLLAEVCAQGSIALSDCARRAEIPTSTALRLLRTLENSDFVTRDADGLFGAGPRLLQLGAAALGRNHLSKIAQPCLERVVLATGESAYLAVRGPGDTALYLAVVEGTHAIRHTSWVGRTVPLRASAVGAALRGDVGDLGYVALRSAVEPDVTSIAAPIRRPDGVAGAVSLVGPTYRISDETMRHYGAMLHDEAAGLSAHFEALSSTGRGVTRA